MIAPGGGYLADRARSMAHGRRSLGEPHRLAARDQPGVYALGRAKMSQRPVEVMEHQINEDPARAIVVPKPVVASGGISALAQKGQGDWSAHGAFAQGGGDPAILGKETNHLPDQQARARGPSGGDHGLGILHGEGQRLLANDLAAMSQTALH